MLSSRVVNFEVTENRVRDSRKRSGELKGENVSDKSKRKVDDNTHLKPEIRTKICTGLDADRPYVPHLRRKRRDRQ